MNVVVAFLTILENVLHSGVHRGGSSPLAPPWEFQGGALPPPGKYKIKRKKI